MNYSEIVQIFEKEPSAQNAADDLKKIIRSGATGGEISSMVGFYLKNTLRLSNAIIYQLFQKEIDEYLNQCKNNGVFIK